MNPTPYAQYCQEQIQAYLWHCLQTDYLLAHSQLPAQALAQNIQHEGLTPGHIALNEVLEPLRKLIFLPGKRWRPNLCLQHALLYSGAQTEAQLRERLHSRECRERVGPLVALVEILHNATLIADDIEDDGQLRRGIPALHLSHGLDRALNSCNWAYFLPASLLNIWRQNAQQLKGPDHRRAWEQALEMQALTTQCLSHIHLGQALDIRWHRQRDYVPSTEEYFFMARLKTGSLAGFAAELGAMAGQLLWDAGFAAGTPQPAQLRGLWLRIGAAFQVLDDLLNITLGNPGKLRGDDWLEGKKSLPLCLFVEHAPTENGDGNGDGAGREERRNTVAQLMQEAQTAALRPNDLAAELERILQKFLNSKSGCQALQDSVNCLQNELAACRQLAIQLYSGFHLEPELCPCSSEILSLLSQLERECQRCSQFVDDGIKSQTNG